MKENLAKALAFIDEDEGPELNLSPGEPGGSSKHGVSMTVLQEWHATKGLPAPDLEDMKRVDSKLAGEIYAARFAVPIRFNDLPSGVDYRLFDIAVSAGITGAIMILQRVLHLAETGKMTDTLIACASKADPQTLIYDLGTEWLKWKIEASADGGAKHAKGWGNRQVRANNRALAMITVAVNLAAPLQSTAKPAQQTQGDSMEIKAHRVYRNGAPVPFKQTPNGGAPLNPVGIICHDTAGDLPGTGSISWLTNPVAKASAHFVVGFDGSLTQLQALNRQCWHAGASVYKGRNGCNGFTIGIEIANPGAMVAHGPVYSNNPANPDKGVKVPATMDVRKASSPHHGEAFWLMYSDAQIATVTELCRAICAAYKINFISTHWEICIPKGRKVDTNPLFPLEKLRADVLGTNA